VIVALKGIGNILSQGTGKDTEQWLFYIKSKRHLRAGIGLGVLLNGSKRPYENGTRNGTTQCFLKVLFIISVPFIVPFLRTFLFISFLSAGPSLSVFLVPFPFKVY